MPEGMGPRVRPSPRLARCAELGGAVVSGPKGQGPGAYCVIQDPAGAVLALMQNPG
ncbi:hypothetical protein GCM10023085_14000 [Actinomadura viridis]|uniref:Enzyme related to lactoylglutathione lyase n=1 Tax=Actinomadura viridis TaxID=58110 RepID=A0A931DW14_9ACTN|nr:hypothetical protein [Actinomadura viridis]MBG6093773.1 putative enzyme related to lactoylglutathione lyase [Actinomadura viridis]